MAYAINYQEFIDEQGVRLSKYYSRNKERLSDFGSKERFITWYLNELTVCGCKCHYCNTSILDIRKLINGGVIMGRAVRGEGLRGPSFEIDRKNPLGKYEESNCVLSCYYCNNDKSNTFSYETYLNVIGPLKGQGWRVLLDQLKVQ